MWKVEKVRYVQSILETVKINLIQIQLLWLVFFLLPEMWRCMQDRFGDKWPTGSGRSISDQ